MNSVEFIAGGTHGCLMALRCIRSDVPFCSLLGLERTLVDSFCVLSPHAMKYFVTQVQSRIEKRLEPHSTRILALDSGALLG